MSFMMQLKRSSSLNNGINELWSLMSWSLGLSDIYFLVSNKELAHNTPFS